MRDFSRHSIYIHLIMFAVQNSSENVIDNLDNDTNSFVIFQTGESDWIVLNTLSITCACRTYTLAGWISHIYQVKSFGRKATVEFLYPFVALQNDDAYCAAAQREILWDLGFCPVLILRIGIGAKIHVKSFENDGWWTSKKVHWIKKEVKYALKWWFHAFARPHSSPVASSREAGRVTTTSHLL